MAKDRKKFKDTLAGKLLIQKLPQAASIIGGLLPDNGVLGIAKNILGAALKKGDITPKDAEAIQKELDYEIQMYKLEVEDRKSARSRQVEMAKTGKGDWMMGITGVIGLAAFGYIVYVATSQEILNENLFYFIAGNVMGVAMSIFSYYFGSSKGSADKSDQMSKL